MAGAEWLVCGGCTIDIEQNAVDKHTEKKTGHFFYNMRRCVAAVRRDKCVFDAYE